MGCDPVRILAETLQTVFVRSDGRPDDRLRSAFSSSYVAFAEVDGAPDVCLRDCELNDGLTAGPSGAYRFEGQLGHAVLSFIAGRSSRIAVRNSTGT